LNQWYDSTYGLLTGINQSIVSGQEFEDGHIHLWFMVLSNNGKIDPSNSSNKIIPLTKDD
jgi:hypothetical protein